MEKWKTPDYYGHEFFDGECNYNARQKKGCTKKFNANGFRHAISEGYAKYNFLCKKCRHYYHSIGVYFGDGHTTDNIAEKSTVLCQCKIRNHEEFVRALSFIPNGVKAVIFYEVRTEALEELERFSELECVLLNYSPKLTRFWDFTKTPKLKVLEYYANPHLTDLTELSRAEELEYLGIKTPTSRMGMNFVESFAPLSGLANLRELLLEAVVCRDNNIDNLIAIPKLEKMWLSPNTFSTEDFAKFEALKFKIFEEYGFFYGYAEHPLGKGRRQLRSAQAKEKFLAEYREMMQQFMK